MKSIIRRILKEEVETKFDIDNFVSFAKNYLGLDNDFKVVLVNDNDDLETMASYDMNTNEIKVNSKNRSFPDIIRSVAHEMTHHLQNQNGDLVGDAEEGSDGSPIENQANAMAGILIRKYGKKYPEIYNL